MDQYPISQELLLNLEKEYRLTWILSSPVNFKLNIPSIFHLPILLSKTHINPYFMMMIIILMHALQQPDDNFLSEQKLCAIEPIASALHPEDTCNVWTHSYPIHPYIHISFINPHSLQVFLDAVVHPQIFLTQLIFNRLHFLAQFLNLLPEGLDIPFEVLLFPV